MIQMENCCTKDISIGTEWFLCVIEMLIRQWYYNIVKNIKVLLRLLMIHFNAHAVAFSFPCISD